MDARCWCEVWGVSVPARESNGSKVKSSWTLKESDGRLTRYRRLNLLILAMVIVTGRGKSRNAQKWYEYWSTSASLPKLQNLFKTGNNGVSPLQAPSWRFRTPCSLGGRSGNLHRVIPILPGEYLDKRSAKLPLTLRFVSVQGIYWASCIHRGIPVAIRLHPLYRNHLRYVLVQIVSSLTLMCFRLSFGISSPWSADWDS